MKYVIAALFLFASQIHAYPEHWWAPVAKEGAPAWEILPQAAGPGEVIVSKRNELGMNLSNLAPTPFEYRGRQFGSLEGLWQSMLYPEDAKDPRATYPGITWDFTRSEVEKMVMFDAKKAGELALANMKKMGIRWISFEGKRFTYWTPNKKEDHYRIIVEATQEKVRHNPRVREVLMQTKGLILKPDHDQGVNPPPAWRYCEILMEIRDAS